MWSGHAPSSSVRVPFEGPPSLLAQVWYPCAMARRPSSLSHQIWLSILAVSIAMLLLLGWSFLYLEPGTPSYVIGQVSAVVVAVTILGTLLALTSDWVPF